MSTTPSSTVPAVRRVCAVAASIGLTAITLELCRAAFYLVPGSFGTCDDSGTPCDHRLGVAMAIRAVIAFVLAIVQLVLVCRRARRAFQVAFFCYAAGATLILGLIGFALLANEL